MSPYRPAHFCWVGSYAVLGPYYFTHTKNIYSLPAVGIVSEIVLQGIKQVENSVSTLKKLIDKL